MATYKRRKKAGGLRVTKSSSRGKSISKKVKPKKSISSQRKSPGKKG